MVSRARAMRLVQELKEFEAKPPWGISIKPESQENLNMLMISLRGPKGSPYEGGTFKLTALIPDMYPFEPPLLKFVTPVYHPNIDKGGRICMDMLKMPPKGAWLPTMTLETLLVSLQALMASPNCDDPLMMEIAFEFKQDYERFKEKAKRFTEEHAHQ